MLSEEAVRIWHSSTAEEVLGAVPQGGSNGVQRLIGPAEVNSLQASAKPFMDWLDAASEAGDSSAEEEED
jgi:hypothetical protein